MDEYKTNGDDASLTYAEKTAFRKIMDSSDKMFNDLKEVANKYIQISDLDSELLYNAGAGAAGIHPVHPGALFHHRHQGAFPA